MPLDLPNGTRCFIDSNILYYALAPAPPLSQHCLTLLNRAARGEILVSASVPVLSDTIHKVMMFEVAQVSGRERAGLVGYVGRHPEIIARLVEYPKAIRRLRGMPMTIHPVDMELLEEASRISSEQHLLTNDAMILALMRRHALTHLLTNDDDFDHVPDITVWKPR
jgi:predicted nucleic acid-binding protein